MAEPILQMCDPIQTQKEAEAKILSVLLPVPGLRRDISGNLTDDSIQTVMEGVKSLGVQVDSDATKTAVLQEAKTVLCKLNAQYIFLLSMLLTAIARSDQAAVTKELISSLREKNQSMQDVLSVSRYVLDIQTDKVTEGFLGTKVDQFKSYREEFQNMTNVVSANTDALNTGNLTVGQQRTFEISEEKNMYAERLTNMYGLLNVVSIGLLFYIMFTN
jgi:hypothetical protein